MYAHTLIKLTISVFFTQVYAKRAPWYDEVSDLDLLIAPGEAEFVEPEAQLSSLLTRLIGSQQPLDVSTEHTFFLSLTFPELSPTAPLQQAIFEGCDVVEMRVDLLASKVNMCVCVCVCVYIYVYICIYIHKYVRPSLRGVTLSK